MPIGANSGGNLNVYIAEIGYVTKDKFSGAEVVTTVSIHPLLVAPTSISYTDTSRSPVAQTTGGSLVTRSGRALRNVQLSGTFGVDTRGLGPYIGSGEMRFQRFYKEAVRMSEALSSEDVDACIDVLNGTPFISLLAGGWKVPETAETSTFFVNWYDFWNDISFQCLIRNFRWVRQHRNGGSSGMVSYDMTVEEVGPLREGGLGNTIIGTLMTILGTWDDLNDVVKSYTVTNIIDAGASVLAIGASELADSIEAVNAQIDSVTDLMAGNSVGGLSTVAAGAGVTSFLNNVSRMQETAEDLAATINAALGTGQFDADDGAIDPAVVEGEGGNATFDQFVQVTELRDVADSGAFQKAAGKFFGMSRPDYHAFLTAGAVTGRAGPELRGSVLHVVSVTDSAATIESIYGVNWGRILVLNELTPDEALLPGTELQIPQLRARGPQSVKGLPVFGSHIGRAAWGVDLALGLRADSGGRPVLVEEDDALTQGTAWLVEVFGDGILRSIESVPPAVRERYLAKRLSSLLLSDDRIAGVEGISVVVDPAGGFDVEVTLHAINGGTVRAGGAA